MENAASYDTDKLRVRAKHKLKPVMFGLNLSSQNIFFFYFISAETSIHF